MDPVRRLGEVLAAEGYDEDGLGRAAGGLDARAATALRRRGLLSGGRLGALVGLFRDRLPVEADALPPLDLDGLAAEGLVAIEGGRVRALAQISPWLGVLLVHDPDRPKTIDEEHVSGPSSSAEALARATVRRPGESTLDLGTGSGIHALLAARHSQRVVATDVNARALRYAALSARLNGIANVEIRSGSWLEPVRGERFDLVVCNPPYVLSPDRDYLFRDGGEGLAERLVRDLPSHLSEGGFAHVLCNWATRPGEAPWAPVAAWTRGSGCDVLAVTLGFESVIAYAARWSDPLGATAEPEYGDRAARWVEHFRAAELETVWLGIVLLRSRPATTNWFRGLGAPEPTEGWASDHLLRICAAQDWLASGPGPVTEQRLRLVPGHRLETQTSWGPKGYEPPHVGLSPGEGLGVRAAVDHEVLRVLAQLDGRRTIDEIVAEPLATPAAAAALHLLELGLLEPVP